MSEATSVMAIRAAVRGDLSLAAARGLDGHALAALRSLADVARRAGRPDLARTLLEGIVALEPRDEWSLAALAEVCLAAGDSAGARAAAARAEEIGRGRGAVPAVVAILVARVLLADGRASEARSWLSLVANDAGAPAAMRRAARALLPGRRNGA
jgi:predicted Zn-dependent protease